MAQLLLIGSVVILACILCSKLSNRFGIPVLLGFIAMGMLFGSDGIFGIEFNDFALTEQISSVALLFIMFYGGFGTNWNEAKPVAVPSIVLSGMGTLLTAGLCGVFCWLVLKMDLLTGLLLGSVLASTDAASVFSILRSRRLNLKYGTASMLEIESGSNDPFAYMLTVVLLSIRSGEGNLGEIVWLVVSQLAFGILLGVAVALGAVFIMRHYRFKTSNNYMLFIFAVALLAYALPQVLGGNGYLSVYLTGIILGNSSIPDKKPLVNFFDGFTSLMQMILFFVLGLLVTPSQMLHWILPAVLVVVFLTLIARPAVVALLLTPFRCKLRQQSLVAWCGLRGAASIAFSLTVLASDPSLLDSFFNTVFCVVLLSISIQGSLVPLLAKKLDMIDAEGDVLKTFTDYTDETEVQFIQINVTLRHPWANKMVKDVQVLPDTLLAMILRDGETVIPKGDTVILPGDVVVINAVGFSEGGKVHLNELRLRPNHPFCGKQLKDCEFEPNSLVVLIRRGEQTIIPKGKEVVYSGDVLVINYPEEI